MKHILIQKRMQFAKLLPILLAGLAAALFLDWRLSADENSTPAPLTLPVKTATVQIETSYIAKRTFTGRVVAGRTSVLAFELAGTLLLLTTNADLGSPVEVGEQIAALDTRRLRAQKAQLNAELQDVDARLTLATRTLERHRKMFDGGHTSNQRLEEAEANSASLTARRASLLASLDALAVDFEKSIIRAPFSGTITARNADEGTILSAGAPLFEITQDTRLEAHIGMPPAQAKKLRKGLPFRLLSGNRTEIKGAELRAIVPVIGGGTRTMLATFDLPANSANRGELVTAVVDDTIEARGIWVPLRALSADVRGLWRIYTVEKNIKPKAAFETVQVLYTRGESVFVSGSLTDGDIIIIDGTARLAPGQFVRMIEGSGVTTRRFAGGGT